MMTLVMVKNTYVCVYISTGKAPNIYWEYILALDAQFPLNLS